MVEHLADTNILLRATHPPSPQYTVASNAIARLLARGDRVCVTPQNIIEFWSAATRPVVANGMGLPASQVEQQVRQILNFAYLLPDTPAIFGHWLTLVTTLGVSSKQVHDARLVAVMATHGVTHLLTFNGSDFKNYPGITIVDPNMI